MFVPLFGAVLCLLPHAAAATTHSARAWFTSEFHPDEGGYPEQDDPALRAKPPTAVAFSGGGTRSYLCSLGYLRGLHDLGLMQNVRYMSGVSGGTWATVAYVYFQKSHPGGPATDAELLGDILAPQDSSLANLAEMPADSGPSPPTGLLSGDGLPPSPAALPPTEGRGLRTCCL